MSNFNSSVAYSRMDHTENFIGDNGSFIFRWDCLDLYNSGNSHEVLVIN